ncbi:MAG: VanZ family protein [Minwuia sp.]|nr:VanZ family protein [Minwuia sp.]
MTTSSAADRGLPAAPVLIGVTLLLVCLTLLHFHGMPRFQPAGQALDYLESGPVRLDAGEGDPIPARMEVTHQRRGEAFVRFEARLAATAIARGPRRWQQGRLVAIQIGPGGQLRVDLPHVVARLNGDRPGRIYRATFRMAEDTVAVLLRAEILRTTGQLDLLALRLQPLAERPGFSGGSLFIGGCWLLLALMISGWVFRSGWYHRWRPGLVYLVAAPTLLLSVAPAAVTAPLRLGVARNLDLAGMVGETGRAADAALSTNLFSLAKAGHVLMFAAVGAVAMLAIGWRCERGLRSLLQALGFSACFGLVAEMLQLFSPNRTATLFDVSINLSSGTGGVLVAALVLLFWNRSRRLRKGA